eukprot:6101134-Alexandrium_andersonii.AAC.1
MAKQDLRNKGILRESGPLTFTPPGLPPPASNPQNQDGASGRLRGETELRLRPYARTGSTGRPRGQL